LEQAIAEDDFEAFVHIWDLYKLLPTETSMSLDQTLNWIIVYDRPELLDEFIRRTGVGIELPTQETDRDIEESCELITPGRKVYLGLTVHGKKRIDLVTRRYPTTRRNDNQTLVIKAAMKGANDVLVYLHGHRPLTAYQYFASTNSNNPQSRLQKTLSQLSALLPHLLGWTINDLNESPLTAATLTNKLETLKLLFVLSPELLATALHTRYAIPTTHIQSILILFHWNVDRIKFCHFSALLVAVDRGCSPDLFDYLLSLGASVMDVDHREFVVRKNPPYFIVLTFFFFVHRWNIYHLASARGHTKLLAHMLESLPNDTTTVLLTQQSKSNLNTVSLIVYTRLQIRCLTLNQ
jgi:hypothetical protein